MVKQNYRVVFSVDATSDKSDYIQHKQKPDIFGPGCDWNISKKYLKEAKALAESIAQWLKEQGIMTDEDHIKSDQIGIVRERIRNAWANSPVRNDCIIPFGTYMEQVLSYLHEERYYLDDEINDYINRKQAPVRRDPSSARKNPQRSDSSSRWWGKTQKRQVGGR